MGGVFTQSTEVVELDGTLVFYVLYCILNQLWQRLFHSITLNDIPCGGSTTMTADRGRAMTFKTFKTFEDHYRHDHCR